MKQFATLICSHVLIRPARTQPQTAVHKKQGPPWMKTDINHDHISTYFDPCKSVSSVFIRGQISGFVHSRRSSANHCGTPFGNNFCKNSLSLAMGLKRSKSNSSFHCLTKFLGSIVLALPNSFSAAALSPVK